MKSLNFSEKFKNLPCYFKGLWHGKIIHCLEPLALPLQFYSTDLAFVFAVGWILRDAELFLFFLT